MAEGRPAMMPVVRSRGHSFWPEKWQEKRLALVAASVTQRNKPLQPLILADIAGTFLMLV